MSPARVRQVFARQANPTTETQLGQATNARFRMRTMASGDAVERGDPMSAVIRESDLYPKLSRWLRGSYGCFATKHNLGLQHSRVDVLGIRDVGGDLSGEVETIAIEVKRGNQPFATTSGQARGYSVYADRVYLADIRADGFSRS